MPSYSSLAFWYSSHGSCGAAGRGNNVSRVMCRGGMCHVLCVAGGCVMCYVSRGDVSCVMCRRGMCNVLCVTGGCVMCNVPRGDV